MRKWLLPGGLLAILLSGAVLADVGSSIKGGGSSGISGTWTGNTELRDPTMLAGESLANPNLTGGTSWTATAVFSLASDAATYTAVGANSGSFQQSNGAAAIPWSISAINGWFSFTYTTSAVSGVPVCTIPNTFALSSTPLNVAAGTYTVVFQAMATTVGSFQVSCSSAAAAAVTFDTLSLKRVNGGNLITQGQILAGSGTSSLPSISFLSDPNTGFYRSNDSAGIRIVIDGNESWSWSGSAFSPTQADNQALGTTAQPLTHLYVGRSTQGYRTKTLTESAATSFVQVAVASGGHTSGEVIYDVYATDGSNRQSLSGNIRIAIVNQGGTETCPTPTDTGTPMLAQSSASTLTCTWTCDTSPTNAVNLQANCVSGLTQTTFEIHYRLNLTDWAALTGL